MNIWVFQIQTSKGLYCAGLANWETCFWSCSPGSLCLDQTESDPRHRLWYWSHPSFLTWLVFKLVGTVAVKELLVGGSLTSQHFSYEHLIRFCSNIFIWTNITRDSDVLIWPVVVTKWGKTRDHIPIKVQIGEKSSVSDLVTTHKLKNTVHCHDDQCNLRKSFDACP